MGRKHLIFLVKYFVMVESRAKTFQRRTIGYEHIDDTGYLAKEEAFESLTRSPFWNRRRQRYCDSSHVATALASSESSVWATAAMTGALARVPFWKTSICRSR